MTLVSVPVRTLMAPCTALTSPLTNISISRVKSCGQASGQSQCAMADTAYATLDRTLLMDSRRPLGSKLLMAALACSGEGSREKLQCRLLASAGAQWRCVWYLIGGFRGAEFL